VVPCNHSADWGTKESMPIYDFKEFLRLSSVLNYNLSAASLNRYNVLLFILGDKKLRSDSQIDREEKGIVMEALNYLFRVYSDKRRRLGPMAVLHPLRSAALFVRSGAEFNLASLLCALFHDVPEDISITDFDLQQWKDMEGQLFNLMERVGDANEHAIVARLRHLTRNRTENYYQYIGRLLENTQDAPDLVQIKLADRLDNTLDMRIDLQDPLGDVDFFRTLFQILFVNNYPGYLPQTEHPPTAVMNGARRLYQLFKNAVILSLIRQVVEISAESATQTLFDALSDASLLEAQRTLIHLLGYHHKNLTSQRTLIMEAMAYCYGGRTDLVTKPNQKWRLDGLFSGYFDHPSKEILNQHLDRLYQDKALMVETSIAFIVIFLSFLNEPDYFVKGISAAGITPGSAVSA
jgi:hypothetical protein